jgi:integrase
MAKAATPRTKHRDMRWLEVRYQTYYAVRDVPRPLREKLGKKRLIKSLGTRDYHVARARRHAALAEFERIIAQARGIAANDDLTAAALAWRETFAKIAAGDRSAFSVGGPEDEITDPNRLRQHAAWIVDEEAEDIEAEHGEAAAATFAGIAHGMATPLLLHVDSWLKEGGAKGPINPRTAAQYRGDVTRFADWARGVGVTTIEGVTEAVAGRYVTSELVGKGIHPGTGNRRISAVSAYWRWLKKRAGVKGNPWVGQSLAKPSARNGDKSKRAFTDDEVRALLAGPADAELADAMRVAALSGMRLEEIYRLTAQDCRDGWFNVRLSKSEAGVRKVPVHSALAGLVARRTEGKSARDYLFHEAGEAPEDRERSAAVSKRFGKYRQRRGVHEKAEGARHSKVDFHSWRRWFITTARNAGIDRAVVAAVAGHAAEGITDIVYHSGPTAALLRACVEAVKLPV